jgi:hypothetical protein
MSVQPHHHARAGAAIFLACCLVRGFLLFSWMTPPALVRPDTTSEVGRVAQRLLASGDFADPYVIPTGPTAHPPPICTGLLWMIYRVFGVSTTAAYVRAILHIVSEAALLALMPWTASVLGLGTVAGIVAGAAGALFPWRGLWDVIGWSGSEIHAAILLAFLLVWCQRRWTAGATAAGSFGLGLAFGAGFHLVPALVQVMAGCLACDVWWLSGRSRWRAPALLLAGAAIACVPWAWRNEVALGGLPFVRSNLGLELRVGHHDGAAPDIEGMQPWLKTHHPGASEDEALRVRAEGELAYMRRARGDACSWVAAHPAEALRLTASRVGHVWFGSPREPGGSAVLTLITLLGVLGMRRMVPVLTGPQRAALIVPLAAFPFVYYLVAYMPRYRVPIDWILCLFAAAEVSGWFRGPRGRRVEGTPGGRPKL